MLGGRHFQKKIDKRARKKASRQAARGEAFGYSHTARGETGALVGAGQDLSRSGDGSNVSAAKLERRARRKESKKHHGSTLKGPVVVREQGASRDSGNDRRHVPWSRASSSSSLHKHNTAGAGHGNQLDNTNTRGRNSKNSSTSVGGSANISGSKGCGANSAAQRRQVLRTRTDDDLLTHFRDKLNASTFRLLNEQIYSSSNARIGQLLSEERVFRDYHTGYRQQLVQWPTNPNQIMIDCLLGDKRAKFAGNKTKRLAGHIPLSWVVADMGCGEAQIASALTPHGYTVHSFDLCALNPLVTVANTNAVPLADASVDVCIFSLSLMATDYAESLLEAFRILKPNRMLKIIEVRSRIPFPHKFAAMIRDIGFDMDYSDVVSDYFVGFDFIKRDGLEGPNRLACANAGELLLPSLYKKR